jgi:anti-sigma B factor antagonist
MPLHPRRPLLRVTTVQGTTIVRVAIDDLGEDSVHTVGEQLSRLVEGLDQPDLVVDMEEVRFLTSTALGKLLALHKRVRTAGGRLTLTGVAAPVYEVFRVTRLHEVLDVRPRLAS